MIYIDRDRLDELGRPIVPNQEWFQKAGKLTEQALKDGSDHKVRDHYRHAEIKKASAKLFHHKCAYCESDLRNVEWDVEHFRPKKAVAERPDHPGYYWLAYTWANLYPSCKFCNQRREDKPTWDDDTAGETAGKFYQFPLLDEAKRAMNPDANIAQEQPLLLDPCLDKPELYLKFNLLGEAVAIADDKRGLATIKICFLNRRALRSLRVKKISEVIGLVKVIREQEIQGNMELVHELRDYIQEHHLVDTEIYSATGRCVVNDPEAFGLG